jgi:hypothetical protein
LGFEKNAIFFTENWQKSPKIMIITSTPGHPDFIILSDINDRKEKRYKEVSHASDKITHLLAECQKLFRADENAEVWWDYLVRPLRQLRGV